MSLHRFRIFTLDQANALLPEVSALTERTRAGIEQLQGTETDAQNTPSGTAVDGVRELIDGWAQSILALGAQPKGVFTVDFRTPDPNVVWCWAPDEPEICHRHFTWESFKDRICLTPGSDTWPGRN